MDKALEVIRDIGTITTTIGETTIEVKVMIEIGVGHQIDRIEVGEETKA